VRVNLVRPPPRRPRPTWARREAPVILTVDAAAMHAAGHAFYQAANGVWLTDHVLPGDLSGWPG
jgi:putative RNA 2'-phosphotransferase